MKPRWLLFAVAVCCFTACPSDPGTRLDPGDDDPVDTDDEEIDVPDIPEDAGFSALWGSGGEDWDSTRFGDFSYAGYGSGEEAIPDLEVVTNVRDFGALGDGVTNDLSAFRAALDATTEGVLWIPRGRYVLQSSSGIRLDIDKSNVVLRGDGSGEDGTVLLVESPAQCDDDGNQGDCYGTGVLRFGKESNYSSSLSSRFSDIVEPAYRGDTTLDLETTSGLHVGDLVLLHLKEDSQRSLGRHLMAEFSEPNDKDYNDGNESNYYWPVHIAAITGNTIQLAQPLRVDVRSEWKPAVRQAHLIEQVGLEHMRIDFIDRKHTSHFASNAYNAVDFTGVVNGWIRNVAIRDSDLPIWIEHAKNVTLTEIEILPRVIGPSGGHHGITFYRAADCLLEHFSIDTEYVHDITLYGHSNGNVVRQGRGLDLNIDFHTRLPHENLVTCVDFGAGSRPFASSGPGGRHHSAGREVYWGNFSEGWPAGLGTMPLPDSSNQWAEMMATFVPAAQEQGTENGDSRLWAEPVEKLYPCDLYGAQRFKRLSGQ